HAERDADGAFVAHARRNGTRGAHERELAAEARREKPRETPRAVAALLDLAAVGVVDAIARVAVAGLFGLDQEQLIEADAEAPIRPAPHELGLGQRPAGGPLDDHEVVAEAVHFGELELHFGWQWTRDRV